MEQSSDAALKISKAEFVDMLSEAFRADFQALHSEFQALAASVRDALKNPAALRETTVSLRAAANPSNHHTAVQSSEAGAGQKHFSALPGCVNESCRPPMTNHISFEDEDGFEVSGDSQRLRASKTVEATIHSSKLTLYRPVETPPTPVIANFIERSEAITATGCRKSLASTDSVSCTLTGTERAIDHVKTFVRPVAETKILPRSSAVSDGSLSPAQNQCTCMVLATLAIKSIWFDYVICALIVLNSVAIGAEVDTRARKPSQDVPSVFTVFEVFFCVVFTAELFLRIFVNGRGFFTKHGRAWNLFDTALVCTQIIDVVIALFAKLDSSASVTRSARLIRVFRLVRVVRVLRLVHVVDELRKLVYLILASFQSFIWTLVLFLVVTYIFAIFFSQLVADAAERVLRDFGPDIPIFLYFGDVGTSMNSLYQAVTGGVDWEIMSSGLMEHISVWLGVIFALYVAFGTLVILNLVTGVFVEGAVRLTKQDREAELLRKVRRVFRHTDDHESAVITREDFLCQLDTDEMGDILQLLEIDSKIAVTLFEMLESGSDGGSLTAVDFVAGALTLKGPARAFHVQGLCSVQLELCTEILEGIAGLKKGIYEITRAKAPVVDLSP